MSNILIINTHQYYPFSEGKFTKTLVDNIASLLSAKNHEIRIITMQDEWDVETELKNHLWADIVILQIPVNWMGVSWSFKKYMDEVYTAGMGGDLCLGDGRDESDPTANYGKGGTLTNTKYMLSLTFNAPAESFNNRQEFFDGKSVDDLMFPMHMNFKFFGMKALPTFVCFDVMKNPNIEQDLERLTVHLNQVF